MKAVVILYVLFFSVVGFSYVENTVKGYANCLACHYSPTGGDLLNDYGRSLSKEDMSTWSLSKNAEKPFFGSFKESKWARLGGDVRTIQTYVDNDFVESRKLFLMQSNVELGVKIKNILLVGTAGFRGGPSEAPNNGDFVSERHYALVNINEQTKLRLGKFRPLFGINDPNHTRATKALLGFGALTETYNLEFFKFTENYEILVNASFGAFDGRLEEEFLSSTFTHYLGGSSRLGLSVLVGKLDGEQRRVLSTFGVLPISPKLYGMYEMDYQIGESQGARFRDLFAAYTRLGYRVFKGFQSYISYEHASPDLDVSGNYLRSPGLGVQWMPIPHTELQFEIQRQKNSLSGIYTTAGFLQAHYYF